MLLHVDWQMKGKRNGSKILKFFAYNLPAVCSTGKWIETLHAENINYFLKIQTRGFPDGWGKESACNAGDMGSIPGSEDLLEEGMATHSSILAWQTAWTEEAGGLQSTGSQSQTWLSNWAHIHPR